MTNNIEEKLTVLLEVAAKAEDKIKAELRQITKELIKARIEEGDEGPIERLLNAVMTSTQIILPKSEHARILAGTVIDSREEEKARQTSIYSQVEDIINKMTTRDLCNLIGKLKREVPLDRIFKTMMRVKRTYEPHPKGASSDKHTVSEKVPKYVQRV